MYVPSILTAIISISTVCLFFMDITQEVNFLEFQGVSICDINEESGKSITQELQQEFGKGRVLFIKTDVANENELKSE